MKMMINKANNLTYTFLVSFQLKQNHSDFANIELDDEQADRLIALVKDSSLTLEDRMAAFSPEMLKDHILQTARKWFVMELIDNGEVGQEFLDEAAHSVDLDSMDLVYFLMDNEKFWESVCFDPRAAITDIEYLDTIQAHRVTNRTDNRYLPALLKDVIRACGSFHVFPRDIVIEDYDLDDVYLSCGNGDSKYFIRTWNIEEEKKSNALWIEWTLFRKMGESQGAERIEGDTAFIRIFDVGEAIYREAWRDRDSIIVFLADGEAVKAKPHSGHEWTGEDILSHLEIAGLNPKKWKFAQERGDFTYVASDENELIALMSNELFAKVTKVSRIKPVKTGFGKLKLR